LELDSLLHLLRILLGLLWELSEVLDDSAVDAVLGNFIAFGAPYHREVVELFIDIGDMRDQCYHIIGGQGVSCVVRDSQDSCVSFGTHIQDTDPFNFSY